MLIAKVLIMLRYKTKLGMIYNRLMNNMPRYS